ncbi:MAG: hypothetical protein IJU89_04325 [Alphaproteobacteria bacterium]|nr:hypothetical protein [Alphaproteobacteria bacterium]
MKKTLKTVAIAAATMITTGAMASVTKNMENPLYTPKSGEFYSKTGLGLMYKKSDHTNAMRNKGTAGDPEFPVYRATEDFGYGFSDSLTGYVSLGYTHNGDIDRRGMHRGRLGLNYRVIETLENFVWDIYGEGYLSGVSPMKGSYGADGFTYKNFSNGRWGAVFGTKVGKRWSKLTTSVFFEYLQTFGNHNNEIDVTAIPMFTTVDKIAVDLKSTNETTIGINAFYQTNDRWSFGGGFRFVEHSDNGVKSVHTKLNTPAEIGTAKMLLAQTKDMDDGWHEYILSGVLANQVTDYLQLALVGEYTFDFSHPNSQNGTDVKMELGVRANVRF